MFVKSLKQASFGILRLHRSKFQVSTVWGLNHDCFFPIFHKRVFRFIKHFQMFNITFRIKEKLGTRRFFTVKTQAWFWRSQNQFRKMELLLVSCIQSLQAEIYCFDYNFKTSILIKSFRLLSYDAFWIGANDQEREGVWVGNYNLLLGFS